MAEIITYLQTDTPPDAIARAIAKSIKEEAEEND